MDFPPYTFKEYPKQITLSDGSTIVVADQRAELDAIADKPPPGPTQAELDLAKAAEDRVALEKEIAELKAKLEVKAAAPKAPAPAPKV